MIRKNQFPAGVPAAILACAAILCVLLLPACGLVAEAGLRGKTADGEDWHLGLKSPPVSWPFRAQGGSSSTFNVQRSAFNVLIDGPDPDPRPDPVRPPRQTAASAGLTSR